MGEKIMNRRTLAWIGAGLLVLIAIYAGLAYALTPALWRHYEHQHALSDFGAVTETKLGIPGDAINVGLEGSQEDVLCAMNAAGWTPADPVTWRSSLGIVDSVLFRRRYPRAPVSDLYYQGRRQDLAFEKPSGVSPSTRHHVRFWKVLDRGDAGEPVWLGAATFDRSVGVSHYTGQITHHIAPDIDADRDLLMADLAKAGKVSQTYSVSGIGPTLFGRNGGGDSYFTDGEIDVARLYSGCETKGGAPEALPSPQAVQSKNRVFALLARIWRAMP
jgi:hypothetical protein